MKRQIRQFKYGFSFIIFGLGGLALSYVIFPMVWIFVRKKSRREDTCQWLISKLFKLFTLFMHYFGVINFTIHGKDFFVDGEGGVIIANHPSLIDVVIIIGQLNQCDCIVKSNLWQNVFIKHVVKMAGYIPNDTDNMLEECRERVSRGRKVLVFPEGTRTQPDKNIQCQRGAAQLAVRTGAKIQRVVIECKPLTLYKGVRWYQVPNCTPHFDVFVTKSESIEPLVNYFTITPIAARELTRYFNISLSPRLKGNNYSLKDYLSERIKSKNKAVNH